MNLNQTINSQGSREPVFTTIKETAELLRVSRPTLKRWTDAELLTAYKVGGKVLYNRQEVINSLYLTSSKNKSYKR